MYLKQRWFFLTRLSAEKKLVNVEKRETADRVISETCVRAMKKDLKAPPVSCLRFPFSSFSDLYVPWKYMDESKEEHVRKLETILDEN